MFQSFQEYQGEGNRTPEELFLKHFTAEPVRDEILEDTTSYQEVITTPAIYPQEEWWDLEIVEDSLLSAATLAKSRPSRRGSATSSVETRSTNSSDRRSGQIRKKTQSFDVDQYTRSVIPPRSRTGPISLKRVQNQH